MNGVLALRADAVLFDSDGVLVDSHREVEVAWSRLADELGLDPAPLLAELAGVPSRQTLGRHLTGAALDRAVARLEDLEVEAAATITAIPGAAPLVSSLGPGTVAFVTSASRRLGVARWAAAAIPVPAHVVTADDVRRGKPDPEPFLRAAAALGVDPRRCVIVEDSPAGGAAARAAGAVVVAVGATPWPTDPDVRVPDLRPVTAGPGRDGFAITLQIATDIVRGADGSVPTNGEGA